jgi:hypothetical protein
VVVMIGFMTHMCVSSTVRAALDRGYATTLMWAATASRELPDNHRGTGGPLCRCGKPGWMSSLSNRLCRPGHF